VSWAANQASCAGVFGRDRQTGVAKVIERRFDADGLRVGYDQYVYVLDITPDGGDPPFRVEARITLRDTPEFTAPGIGDSARVTFNGKHEHVEFDVDALKQAADAAGEERDARFAAIAAAPAGSDAAYPGAEAQLDPDLQALMDREAQERKADSGPGVVAE
jgi:hypothetical protein